MNLASVIQIPALGEISIELLIIIALSLLCIILLIVSVHAHRRISRILRGKNTMTIEDSIIELAKELDSLTEFKEKSEDYHKLIEQRLRKSVQSIETKRFNPFKGTGTGGNQSFASAFINENGDGLILSSLYSSDRMSVFAKPVQNFTSTFELTDEEAEALESAKNRVEM
jgi:predicted DNA binding protein